MLEPREHTACCGRLVECLCLHSVDVEAHHGPIRCHGVVVPLHELLGPERRGVNGRRTKKESVAGTAEAIEKVVITRVGENRVDREHIRAGLLPLGPHRQGEAGSEPGDRRVHRVQRSGLAPSDLGVRVEAQRVPVIRRGGWEQPAEGAEHRGPAPRRSRTLLTRRGPSPQSPGRAARSGSRGNPGGGPGSTILPREDKRDRRRNPNLVFFRGWSRQLTTLTSNTRLYTCCGLLTPSLICTASDLSAPRGRMLDPRGRTLVDVDDAAATTSTARGEETGCGCARRRTTHRPHIQNSAAVSNPAT